MSISFNVIRRMFDEDLAALEAETAAATKVGLRAVGREMVRAEKRYAPVYAGPGGVTRKQVKSSGKPPSRSGRPVVGLLRFSVKTGRVQRSLGGARIVVGPGGGRVNLYKGKIERKYGFAAKAYGEIVPQSRIIMEAAWAKALAKGA